MTTNRIRNDSHRHRHRLAATAAAAVLVLGLGAAVLARSVAPEPVTDGRTLLIQLGVTDLDRSVQFYRDVLGFEIESVSAELKWARVKPGMAGITIGLGEKPDARGSGTTSLNFGVKDIETARATLEERGVRFLGPTITVPGVVQLADFEDPDGNRIRLAGHPG